MKKKTNISSFWVFMLLAVIFYLIMSFISVDLNPLEWFTGCKVVYAVGAMLTGLAIAAED